MVVVQEVGVVVVAEMTHAYRLNEVRTPAAPAPANVLFSRRGTVGDAVGASGASMLVVRLSDDAEPVPACADLASALDPAV